MKSLRSRQPYHTLSSTETIPRQDQSTDVELQSYPEPVTPKFDLSLGEPILRASSTDPNISSSKWLYAWRAGTLGAALAVTISLIINISVAIWLSRNATFLAGLAELTQGECGRIENIDLFVHLCINILSTIMLAGSNYTMQILMGPSRAEVDNAHRKGKWLDIGIPSLRNLTSVSRVNAWLWGVLLLSSLPLHLMFNSAFYSSLATNDYDIFVTNESFLSNANFTYTASVFSGDTEGISYNDHGSNINITETVQSLANLELLRQKIDKLENLTNADCIKAYAQDFTADRRNLIIISSNDSSSNALLHVDEYWFGAAISTMDLYNPYAWICSDPAIIEYAQSHGDNDYGNEEVDFCPPFLSYAIAHASEWAPYGYPAMYCLSETVPERCNFNANLSIIITVIMCNIVKAAVMFYVAWAYHSRPMLVIGDAVASFLTIPDQTTKNMCLLTRSEVETKHISRLRWPADKRRQQGLPPLPYGIATSKRRIWASAPSARRWAITIVLLISCIAVVLGLLVFGFVTSIPPLPISAIGNLGFGKVNALSLIKAGSTGIGDISSASGQVISSVLIANLPQLVLSLLYFNINGLLTIMLMSNEWSNFAVQRNYLRVTYPRDNQRSTYFLNIPYRFAVPLLVLSVLFHWLASQSIFLAVVSEWSPTGTLISTNSIATCGFSPLPIISIIALGIVVLVVLILLGRRKYNHFIPLVGSCSAAIAAACHASDEDEDIATRPLLWGAIETFRSFSNDLADLETVGHCCFSAGEVTTTVEGMQYAGLPLKQT